MESLTILYFQLAELEDYAPTMSTEEYETKKIALEKEIDDTEWQYLDAQNLW